MRKISIKSVVSFSICLLGLLVIIPAASAGGGVDTANQTHNTELRDRIVNTSHVTEEMMQGAVQYIDQISDGSGATSMRATRDNYVSAAAALPSIQNGTELRTADIGLMKIEHLFFNQTEVAMKTYNGTPAALRQSINTTLSAAGMRMDGYGPRPGHALGFAGNETNRPDHAPDVVDNETARPDFAGNGTCHLEHRGGFVGNETAHPDQAPGFAGNNTARQDHTSGFAANGTAHSGNGSSSGNGGALSGNGTAGRHNRGVNVSVN